MYMRFPFRRAELKKKRLRYLLVDEKTNMNNKSIKLFTSKCDSFTVDEALYEKKILHFL